MWRVAAVLAVLVGCRGAQPARAAPPVVPVQPTAPVEPVTTVPVVATTGPGDAAPTEPAPPVTEQSVPAEPAKVQVSFAFEPEIGEGPPVLAITVRNPSTRAVPMTRFDDVRCVVQHYLELRVVGPGRKPVVWSACAVKDWPGREGPLAAGGELQLRVPLAELAARWPRGTYAADVAWEPRELARVLGEAAAVRASQTSLNIDEFTIARPLVTVKIRRGATVTLPDGVQLRFRGHSHKDVGPGDSSPLIVRGELTRAGQTRAEEFSLNLHTEHTRVFRLQEVLAFELVDYAYDDWMKLKYYGQVRRR